MLISVSPSPGPFIPYLNKFSAVLIDDGLVEQLACEAVHVLDAGGLWLLVGFAGLDIGNQLKKKTYFFGKKGKWKVPERRGEEPIQIETWPNLWPRRWY